MGLFTFDGIDTGGDQYLGRKIQQRLKLLREEKLWIVKKQFGLDTISRPSIDTCDISDTDSIIRFLAQENLDCAFNCEPDTPVSRVQELCDIILGRIPPDKHIHIVPHENTDTAAKDKSGSDMFGYFEIWLREDSQDNTYQLSAINRFKSFFIQALGSSIH